MQVYPGNSVRVLACGYAFLFTSGLNFGAYPRPFTNERFNGWTAGAIWHARGLTLGDNVEPKRANRTNKGPYVRGLREGG